MRARTRGAFFFCGVGLILSLSGCTYLPGAHAADTMTIVPAHIANMTLQLGDLPAGFRLVTDLAPASVQLAQQLAPDLPGDQQALAATLNQLRRRAGTYRVFSYSQPEPSTINGAVQAVVEVDLFDTIAHAQAWLDDRQPALTAAYGPAVAVGAPGQHHIVHMRVQHGESIAATDSVLSFTERNVFVEIATVLIGQGPSLAEGERYA